MFHGAPVQKEGKDGKGALILQIRMLRARQHQAALRQAIEKEQEDIMRLSERAYRKFTRSTFRQRVDMFKQVRHSSPHEPSG